MILDILAKYQDIVVDRQLSKFKLVGKSYQLICQINFVDNSALFVKDYLFQDSSKKYSYHWQDKNGECIIRWDNAPHHQSVDSFPYHKHIGKNERIEAAMPMTLG